MTRFDEVNTPAFSCVSQSDCVAVCISRLPPGYTHIGRAIGETGTMTYLPYVSQGTSTSIPSVSRIPIIMSQTSSRIPLVQPGTRPELAEIEQTILAERGRISPLYQVLLNSGPIASGWERMLTAVRNQSLLPADLREILIIRVAVLNKATFELHAHIPHAEKAGVSQQKINALQRPQPDLALFTADEALLLRMADAMTRHVEVPADIMDAVTQRFDARGVLEAVTTVAAYNMVSRLLVALGIEH